MNPDITHFCLTALGKPIRDRIRELLFPISIPIDVFRVRIRGGSLAKFRLNHLAKEFATLSWSAEHGGSILLMILFEDQGRELLGTFQGEINNGRLSIYLSTTVGPEGNLNATPFVNFSADINIVGLSDSLEPRQRIRNEVAAGARDALGSSAQDLALAMITSLIPDPPPADAFFTQMAINEGSATVTWADSLQRADIVIEAVEPNLGDGELLSLSLSGGWAGGPISAVHRFAPPNSQLAVPLKLAGLALPDGQALSIGIKMTAHDPFAHAQARDVGTILRSFAAPGYGTGVHTDEDRELSVRYRVTLH